jgi:ABC-2 type transport system permease protein
MSDAYRFIIRLTSFLGKEIAEVVRQPRLILTLVFGPFLILLVFGIGYINQPRTVRTLFVVVPNSQMAQLIQQQAPTISSALIYAGQTGNEAEAKQRLAAGQVDLVVVAPANAYQTIQNNQQAVFKLYHNEIDPAQIGYMNELGQVFVQEVNRRVLSSVVQQTQAQSSSVKNEVSAARQNAAAMKAALMAGNAVAAQSSQVKLKDNLSALSLALGASASLLNGIGQDTSSSNTTNNAQDLANILKNIENSPSNTTDIQAGQSSYTQEIQALSKTELDLASLQADLNQFKQISPFISVSPFTSQTNSIAPVTLTPLDFFTPGVIVLLLQHIAVTIASLSIVRERRSGTMELFRVSPISASEVLIGKYLSYMIFGVFLAAVLALLLAYGLKIPMLGRWLDFSIVALAVIFASLGYGFVISLIAQTESQAVQLAMIMLLLSVFFSGFLLDLRYFAAPVKIISWLLPTTYGSVLLQNIMLRGNPLVLIYISGLLGMGLILFGLSWLLMKRQMSHE